MEVRRLFDIFPYQEKKFPQEVALAGKHSGKWAKYSTRQVNELTDKLALGMSELGLKRGDMIAIISHTNENWVITDNAIQKMGGIVIPIYPTSTPEDVSYILNHCEAKAIFAHDKDLMEKVQAIKGDVPSLKHFFSFQDVSGIPNFRSLERELTDENKAKLAEIQAEVKYEDLATIIYTSGTTGRPKGVMLTHENILSNLFNTEDFLPVGHEHDALSFLPLSHIFERMINYLYFYTGVSVHYAESLETIGDDLKEVRPHVFTAVPRLLEKVYDKIQAKGASAGGLKSKIFAWATKLALEWSPDGANGGWYNFKHGLAEKLVYSKIRQGAGLDRVLACASGSAALQPRLMRYYNGAGIPLVEGYGLTETSPVISVGGFGPKEMKIGTVGRVINDGEVVIAEDGEILYKGPNVMIGYYKNEEKTKEVINSDNYFHTGDIGVLDKDGFLKITDRKKEIFKTSGGKYIAPQLMENKYKESIYIEQVMVLGEYKKFPGALLVPNFEELTKYLDEKGVSYSASKFAELCALPEVKSLYESEIARLNAGFAKWEKVKRFEIVPQAWTPESGLVTPTLKLKRKVILEHFKDEVEEIYNV